MQLNLAQHSELVSKHLCAMHEARKAFIKQSQMTNFVKH